MIHLKIPIEPMGAVRMTGRGKFIKENAQRYLSYKGRIQWEVKKQLKFQKVLTEHIEANIIFYMPIPSSWSLKKRKAAIGAYHTKKPDIDNLIKGVFDALNKLVWKDDNLVAKINAKKIYSEQPGIEIEILILR